MKRQPTKIAVIAGGAWGLALASLYHNDGRDVCVFKQDEATHQTLQTGGQHARVLKGIHLPQMKASYEFDGLSDYDIVLMGVRAQGLRQKLTSIKANISPSAQIVLCCKGIEHGTFNLMSEVAHSVCPQSEVAVLSGPSFANDVASGLPTAVSLACRTPDIADTLVGVLKTPTLRPYVTEDIVGVEVGGSVKNVLALACGMAKGLALGQSAHAALLSRGFVEMSRLGIAMGGQFETISGLSGLGDLVLTLRLRTVTEYAVRHGSWVWKNA